MQTTTVEFYVYVHRRATDGRVFYVGKGHGKRAWRTEGRNPKWQRIAKKYGFAVEIIFRTTDEQAAMDFECATIAEYGIANLANLTLGGQGGIGRIVSGETRKKARELAKAQWQRPGVKEKAVAQRKQEWKREGHREALSATHKQLWSDPAHAKRMSDAHKGHEHTETQRAKMAAAAKAQWADPVKRAAMLAARANKRRALERAANVEEQR